MGKQSRLDYLQGCVIRGECSAQETQELADLARQMLEALKAIIAAEDEFARQVAADRGIVIDDKITDALELGRAAIAAAEPETEK